jgi:hypothetical protein
MTILENLQNYINDDNNKYYGYEISSYDAKEIVEALQFHQSVVRCKDCRYVRIEDLDIPYYCDKFESPVEKWSYCSDGVRRCEE